MSLALIVIFLSLVLLVANRAVASPAIRPTMFGLLGFIDAGIIVVYGVLPLLESEQDTQAPVSRSNAIGGLIIAIGVAGLASAIMFTPIRRWLARFFPRPSETGGFDPESLPHMIALIFCVYMIGDTILEYTLAGGIGGLAKQFQSPTVTDLLVQMLAFVTVAAIGSGLFSRRTPAQVIERLGLRLPTISELWMGAMVSIALIGFSFLVSVTWQSVTPSDTVTQQTQLSTQLDSGITTLTFAMLVAGTAAIGEEIAFRGALQPIFGLWPTAIIFALAHIQYTLTPAALVIVGVGLGLGWVRQRYNTTASMVAHFLYDFLPLALGLYLHYLQVTGGS